jgi:hypothetical protein
MSDHTPETQDTPPNASKNDAINQSRRKLTGAALGVSAVFTLASRPVLAGVCQTPSAALSGNMSQHGTPTTCSGRSPGYWKENPNAWPSTISPGTNNGQKNNVADWSGGTLFHPFFAGDRFKADIDSIPSTPNTSLSMMQVMQMNNGNNINHNPWGLTDPDNLGAHIVAALLNARSNLTTSVLPESLVTMMWSEWNSNGYFEPTANVQWTSLDIVNYIKTTFI